ncbi:MAG: hypothetical protein AABW72_00800 [archaeon]
MLIAFIYNLATFNLNWMFQVFITNLHYLFAFSAFMYFLTGGKNFIKAMLVLTLNIWGLLDFMNFAGWIGFVAGFLFLNYTAKLSVFAILSENKKLDKYAIAISEFVAFTLWAYYNLIIAGVNP